MDLGWSENIFKNTWVKVGDKSKIGTDHNMSKIKDTTMIILSFRDSYKMEGEFIDLEKLHDTIKLWQEEVLKSQIAEVSIDTLGSINKADTIYYKEKSNAYKTTWAAKRKFIRDKLIIKSRGKTYAKLLKVVKGSVGIEGTGVEVEWIIKTEITGGKEKTRTCKRRHKIGNSGTKVTIKTNDTAFHIADIDAAMNKEELRKEIAQLRIISLYPIKNEKQTATRSSKLW